MTLDEAIAHAREVAEEHEQIAEWLEDYKHIKQWKSDVMDDFCRYDVNSFEELAANARNKAIDDFVRLADTMPTVEEEDGEIRPMWLEEMAEHLKRGEEI